MACVTEWFNLTAGFTSSCAAGISAYLADYSTNEDWTIAQQGIGIVSGVTWFISALKGLIDCYARNEQDNARADEIRILRQQLQAVVNKLQWEVDQLQQVDELV